MSARLLSIKAPRLKSMHNVLISIVQFAPGPLGKLSHSRHVTRVQSSLTSAQRQRSIPKVLAIGIANNSYFRRGNPNVMARLCPTYCNARSLKKKTLHMGGTPPTPVTVSSHGLQSSTYSFAKSASNFKFNSSTISLIRLVSLSAADTL